MRPLWAASLALVQFTLACRAASSPPGPPPAVPSAEEVRSFLSNVGAAAAGSEEWDLRRFFEGGDSYPKEDLAMLRSSEFWKLRPAPRVERLGPDAFRIRFLPEQPAAREGAVTVSVRIVVPVRRGKDGQLRVLSREETERLEKLPVPEAPEGEMVELDYPDEDTLGRDAGRHYATALWAEAHGDQVRLSLRFDPPILGPRLRADLPITERFPFGEEIRLEIAFDADANAATGFRMDELYGRLPGGASANAQRIQEWQGFGLDKKLALDGKKFVQSDGGRAWGLRATLRTVAAQVETSGGWSDRGEVVFEKTQADPEMQIEGDVLTITVPAALLPMKAGGAYRVILEHNSGYGLILKARNGRIAAAAPHETGS